MTSPIRSQITSPVVSPATLPGKGPFTIPLRTLLIVRCQPVVFESTTYVPGTPLEGAGSELSVPLVRPVPEWLEKGARALCAWSAEMRAHA